MRIGVGDGRVGGSGVHYRDGVGEGGQAGNGVPADHAAALAEIEQLKIALESRTVIATAVGILVERRRHTPDEAFRGLVELSQRSNTKLAAIARELVEEAAGRAAAAPPDALSRAPVVRSPRPEPHRTGAPVRRDVRTQ
jgi:ANTAR domain-containing protein